MPSNVWQEEKIFTWSARDVYFQDDPFSFKIGDALYCALEGPTSTIRDCSYNGPWMEYIYGKEVLNKIGDN